MFFKIHTTIVFKLRYKILNFLSLSGIVFKLRYKILNFLSLSGI